jgi:hypothetical protein
MLSDQLSTAVGERIGPHRWQEARSALLAVLHRETQLYYAALATADKRRPFQLDPARSMVALMFLTTLCLGVTDECQRLQAAVKAVLDSGAKRTCCAPGACMCTRGDSMSAASSRCGGGKAPPQVPLAPARSLQHVVVAGDDAGVPAGAAAATALAASATSRSISATGSSTLAAAVRSACRSLAHPLRADRDSSGTRLLLEVLLMVDVARRLQLALAVQLPAALRSRAGVIVAGESASCACLARRDRCGC